MAEKDLVLGFNLSYIQGKNLALQGENISEKNREKSLEIELDFDSHEIKYGFSDENGKLEVLELSEKTRNSVEGMIKRYLEYYYVHNASQKEIEALWDNLGNVAFDESEEEQDQVLGENWFIFDKGTPRNDIWRFFDTAEHERNLNVSYLLYEYDPYESKTHALSYYNRNDVLAFQGFLNENYPEGKFTFSEAEFILKYEANVEDKPDQITLKDGKLWLHKTPEVGMSDPQKETPDEFELEFGKGIKVVKEILERTLDLYEADAYFPEKNEAPSYYRIKNLYEKLNKAPEIEESEEQKKERLSKFFGNLESSLGPDKPCKFDEMYNWLKKENLPGPGLEENSFIKETCCRLVYDNINFGIFDYDGYAGEDLGDDYRWDIAYAVADEIINNNLRDVFEIQGITDNKILEQFETLLATNKEIKAEKLSKEWQDTLCNNRVNKAVEIITNHYRNYCKDEGFDGYEELDKELKAYADKIQNMNLIDREGIIQGVFESIGEQYDNETGLCTVETFLNDSETVEIHYSFEEIAALIKAVDVIKYGTPSLDFVRPNSLALKEGFENNDEFKDLITGYYLSGDAYEDLTNNKLIGAANSYNQNNELINIEKNDQMSVFEHDTDAALQYCRDNNCKLLTEGIDIWTGLSQGYNSLIPDNKRNREILKELLLDKPLSEKFLWKDFTEEDFNKLVEDIRNFRKTGEFKGEDFRGKVNLGAISIEFVQSDPSVDFVDINYYFLGQEGEGSLEFKNADATVPYSYENGETLSFDLIEICKNYEDFKTKVQTQLIHDIEGVSEYRKEAMVPTIDWENVGECTQYYSKKLGDELYEVYSRNALSMSEEDKNDALRLIDMGADCKKVLLDVAADANLYENCHWFIENISDYLLKEYFADKDFANVMYEKAKESMTSDRGSGFDGISDVGFHGFLEIAELCSKSADAYEEYFNVLREDKLVTEIFPGENKKSNHDALYDVIKKHMPEYEPKLRQLKTFIDYIGSEDFNAHLFVGNGEYDKDFILLDDDDLKKPLINFGDVLARVALNAARDAVLAHDSPVAKQVDEKASMLADFSKEYDKTHFDFAKLADDICQRAYDRSAAGFNFLMDWEDVAELANRTEFWVKENKERIIDELVNHNDELLLDFSEQWVTEEGFDLNFCSIGEDGNDLFKQDRTGRWIRCTDEELIELGYGDEVKESGRAWAYMTKDPLAVWHTKTYIAGILGKELAAVSDETVNAVIDNIGDEGRDYLIFYKDGSISLVDSETDKKIDGNKEVFKVILGNAKFHFENNRGTENENLLEADYRIIEELNGKINPVDIKLDSSQTMQLQNIVDNTDKRTVSFRLIAADDSSLKSVVGNFKNKKGEIYIKADIDEAGSIVGLNGFVYGEDDGPMTDLQDVKSIPESVIDTLESDVYRVLNDYMARNYRGLSIQSKFFTVPEAAGGFKYGSELADHINSHTFSKDAYDLSDDVCEAILYYLNLDDYNLYYDNNREIYICDVSEDFSGKGELCDITHLIAAALESADKFRDGSGFKENSYKLLKETFNKFRNFGSDLDDTARQNNGSVIRGGEFLQSAMNIILPTRTLSFSESECYAVLGVLTHAGIAVCRNFDTGDLFVTDASKYTQPVSTVELLYLALDNAKKYGRDTKIFEELCERAKDFYNPIRKEKVSKTTLSFSSDVDKMLDWDELSKEEFLESYSYISEEEYNATALELSEKGLTGEQQVEILDSQVDTEIILHDVFDKNTAILDPIIDEVKVWHPEIFGNEKDDKLHLLIEFHNNDEFVGESFSSESIERIFNDSNVDYEGRKIEVTVLNADEGKTIEKFLQEHKKQDISLDLNSVYEKLSLTEDIHVVAEGLKVYFPGSSEDYILKVRGTSPESTYYDWYHNGVMVAADGETVSARKNLDETYTLVSDNSEEKIRCKVSKDIFNIISNNVKEPSVEEIVNKAVNVSDEELVGKRFTKQLIAFNKSFNNAWESMKYLMNSYKDNPAENKLLHNWFKTKGFVSKENIENFFKEKNLTFKSEKEISKKKEKKDKGREGR